MLGLLYMYSVLDFIPAEKLRLLDAKARQRIIVQIQNLPAYAPDGRRGVIEYEIVSFNYEWLCRKTPSRVAGMCRDEAVSSHGHALQESTRIGIVPGHEN